MRKTCTGRPQAKLQVRLQAKLQARLQAILKELGAFRDFLPNWVLVLPLLVWGCSTAPTQKPASQPTPALSSTSTISRQSAQKSSVEIEYVLGRDHYRLYAVSEPENVIATSYLEKTVVEEGRINRDRYVEFLNKAFHFIQESGEKLVAQPPCRNPYIVSVKVGEDLKVARGCRSTDRGGMLSKLVREGEFLLYSKN